jgi:hypothetical protein
MAYKRQELRQGNFIVLTELDRQLINLIAECLFASPKKTANLTTIYEYVSERRKKTTERSHIKYCIMLLYIRHHVRINNWRQKRQQAFRTYVRWIK